MSTVNKFIALCFLTFLVTACGYFTGDQGISDYELETMYIDANLLFALALPEPWKEVEQGTWPYPSDDSVAWRSQEQNAAGHPDVVARITSHPPETAIGGFNRLESRFLENRTGFKKISDTETDINGLPALRVVGRFADRQSLVVFITTSRRAFTLEFTAPASEFDAYRLLFEEILQSFRVL